VNYVDYSGRSPAAAAAGTLGTGAGSGGAALGLGAGSAFVATALILGVPVAISILAISSLIDSAETSGDKTGDDEGPNEGGAPPQDGEVDGGSCPVPGGPKTFVPTGDEKDVSPIGDTGLPERPYHDSDPTDIPGAGNPRNPTIPKGHGPTPRIPYPETPEDGFPQLPPGGSWP
jgi:hypothetical protein